MSLKYDPGHSTSNYDECTVLLLSAFFCLTGQTPEDHRLRTVIEGVLVDLAKAQKVTARSNIVRLCPPRPRFP